MLRSRTLLLAFALLVGCRDTSAAPTATCPDPQDPPSAPMVVPGFEVTPARSSIAIPPETAVSLPIAIERQGGFDAPVTITIEGGPWGVVAAPLVIPTGSSVGELELHSKPNVGDIGELTIRAHADGIEATATVTVALTNAPGSKDADFANGGLVVTGGPGTESWHRLAVLPDGRVVVAGRRDNSLLVGRFLPNGTPDPSFDGDGFVTRTFGAAAHQANALEVASDGSIYVAGIVGSSSFVVSVLENGSPNPEFASMGNAYLPGVPDLFGFARLPDGRIRIAAYQGGNIEVFGMRANGTVDTDFQAGGVLVIDEGASEYVAGMVARPDGSVVLVGNSQAVGTVVTYAYAIDASGALRSDFGTAGRMLLDPNGKSLTPTQMVRLADGRVLVGGAGAVFALPETGPAPLDFGIDSGFLQLPGQVYGITEADGRLYFLVPTAGDNKVVRTFLDGVIDRSFGSNGTVSFADPPGDASGSGIGVDGLGRFVVSGGVTANANADAFVLVGFR